MVPRRFSCERRRRPVQELDNAYICKDYFSSWHEVKTLVPIPGVHFNPTSPFACERRFCKLDNITEVPSWHFYAGKLFSAFNADRARLTPPIVGTGWTRSIRSHTSSIMLIVKGEHGNAEDESSTSSSSLEFRLLSSPCRSK